MKRILSLLLAGVMMFSALPMAYATNDYTAGTDVIYTADDEAHENWTITVPAKLAPGGSGPVTLEGTWPSNKLITVDAQENVMLTNSINSNDTKTLAVSFVGISETGNNIESQKFTEYVSVEAISNALFGTWDGHFYYNVDTQEVVSNPSARMRLAISNPASTDPHNPSTTENTQYTVNGYASAGNGIKSLELDCTVNRVLSIIACDYIAMGAHSLYFTEVLSDEEISSFQGKTATCTASDGKSFSFTITSMTSSSIWLSDAYYSDSGIISSEISTNGSCPLTIEIMTLSNSISGQDIGADGLWNWDIELSNNTQAAVTATLEDNNSNSISQTTYISYMDNEPYLYGTYKEGAIEKYLAEGAEAIEDMKLAHWGQFYSYDGAVEIFIHPSVTSISNPIYIDGACFYTPAKLAGIVVPNTATTIADRAFFSSYTNLATVVFEEGSKLASIGHEAFRSCSKLNNVTIPYGVTALGNFGTANTSSCKGFTFNSCPSLTHVTLPASINTLGNGVFGHSALESITFQGTISQWNNIQKASSKQSGGKNYDWNQTCGEITVTCTDGTVIVPAYGS